MLGGRSSFGAGGWASTELAGVLPVAIHPGDGQIEPEGGLKFVPNAHGPRQLPPPGRRRPGAEPARIWDALPPISGTNRFGAPKPARRRAGARAPARPEPLMVGQETGQGRVLAFGGETWVWARASDEGRAAHRKFWRQVDLLARPQGRPGREPGQAHARPPPDRRRPEARPDRHRPRRQERSRSPTPMYETTVTRDGAEGAKPEPVELYTQGTEARGSYFATGSPGEYKVAVIGHAQGPGDRHATPPASWSTRTIARWRTPPPTSPSSGRSPRPPAASPCPAENCRKYLESLDGKMYTEYVDPDRAPRLGQLALLPGLHRPADARVVAPQAARMDVI